MDTEKILSISDTLTEARESITSLRIVSLLLLDACRAGENSEIRSVILCYHQILQQIENELNDCSNALEGME